MGDGARVPQATSRRLGEAVVCYFMFCYFDFMSF